MRADKLWGYAALARVWGRSLVVAAVLVLGAAAAIQAASDDLGGPWLLETGAALASALIVFFFLLRMWMRQTALFSSRLEAATPLPAKPRLHEADVRDWRRWALCMVGSLFVGGVVMTLFLVGLLGRGGTAEGVVAGCIAAWGLVTLEDAGRITAAEKQAGRAYFAACRRPLGVAHHLIWRPAGHGDPA